MSEEENTDRRMHGFERLLTLWVFVDVKTCDV